MSLQRRAVSLVIGSLLVASCGGPTTTTATTTPPANADINDSAVQIIAKGCREADVQGAGLMVADGKIATVAHVVAGATSIEARGAHGTSVATVVYIDPILDVAVLKVDPGLAVPIPIGTASTGDRGTVIVYRKGVPTVLPAEVQRPVNIRTNDIYGDGKHIRPGYELSLDIRAGDSGAVVVVNDKAVALVWAKSNTTDARAWAMRASLVSDHLSSDTPVDNGECI
jgi:Trypsin-like peptidase domain